MIGRAIGLGMMLFALSLSVLFLMFTVVEQDSELRVAALREEALLVVRRIPSSISPDNATYVLDSSLFANISQEIASGYSVRIYDLRTGQTFSMEDIVNGATFSLSVPVAIKVSDYETHPGILTVIRKA